MRNEPSHMQIVLVARLGLGVGPWEMRGRTVELGDSGRGRVEHEDALATQVLLHIELGHVRRVMHCHVLRRTRLRSSKQPTAERKIYNQSNSANRRRLDHRIPKLRECSG